MFTPRESTASRRMADYYGEYLLARLQADPETNDIAKGLESPQSALREADVAEQQAYRKEQAAVAARDHADFKLDEEVRKFELALLGTVSKNRQSKEYKAFFPDGLTAVVAAPLLEELNAVKRIETLLAKSGPEIKKFGTSLGAARGALDKSMGALTEADNQHGLAMTVEMQARREWLRSYRIVYGELVSRIPEARRRVEAYFRAESRGEEEETPAPKPTVS